MRETAGGAPIAGPIRQAVDKRAENEKRIAYGRQEAQTRTILAAVQP